MKPPAPRVVIRERIGWTTLAAGAALLACGFFGGVAWPRQEVVALSVPNATRHLVDVREVRVAGEERVWSVRWLDANDQIRLVQVEGEADRDALVEWVEGETK